MDSQISTTVGADRDGAVHSKDLLGDGNALYKRACNECLPEHRELMAEVWSPTPWMLDVLTAEREQEIWNWCCRHFGRESSPIHGNEGTWHRGNVTMHGRTWFGFKSKMMLDLFETHFPSPNMSEAEQHAIDRLLAEAPVIKELPSDPEWEKVEAAFADRAFKCLAPFEE